MLPLKYIYTINTLSLSYKLSPHQRVAMGGGGGGGGGEGDYTYILLYE